MKLIYLVFTKSGNWGKNEDLFQALKNAKVKGPEELLIKVVVTDEPENVVVLNDGSVKFTGDIFTASDKPYKLIEMISDNELIEATQRKIEGLTSKWQGAKFEKAQKLLRDLDDLKYNYFQ